MILDEPEMLLDLADNDIADVQHEVPGEEGQHQDPVDGLKHQEAIIVQNGQTNLDNFP